MCLQSKSNQPSVDRPGRGDSWNHRRFFTGLALLSILLLAGCRVLVITGPSTVSVGETVTYELELGSNQGGQSPAALFLDVQVPTGWTLSSATYEGVVGGEEVSGALNQSETTICNASLEDLPAGFQRFSLDAGTFDASLAEDSGTVTLEFQVVDQPEGAFDIGFVFGSQGIGLGCSPLTLKRINRSGRAFLELEQVFREVLGGPESLGPVTKVLASPDSRDVYGFHRELPGALSLPGGVRTYRRSGVGGELQLVETILEDAALPLGEVMDAEISSDGRHLYVVDVEADVLGVFTRAEETGSLTFLESLPIAPRNIHPESLVVSPDGLHLYLGDLFQAEIAIFTRNPVDGTLTPSSPFDGLLTPPSALAIDPTGSYLYAAFAEEDKLLVFARDPRSGGLLLVQEVFNGAFGVEGLGFPANLALSRDGKSLYAGGRFNNNGRPSLLTFHRDPKTGMLMFLDAFETTGQTASSDQTFEPSPGGERLFVTLQARLLSFRRSPDGMLTLEDIFQDGYLLRDIVISGDQRHLMSGSFSDLALLSYRMDSPVFADGFESGDTAAWSAASP